MALKISVYQPRVSTPVAPIVQETGANLGPGISALAQGAGQAAQATMMKIKQIEIETETEEGIVAQTAAANEFLDAMKKAPIYSGLNDRGMPVIQGGPNPKLLQGINPLNEDGTWKDREQLHAEVLEKYFAETDAGIQNAPLNPRAKENIQDWWNRQKVQVEDQVRDQMIADDLATLRQRNMSMLKTAQEMGDVKGSDAITHRGMLGGLWSEADKAAMDRQTRFIAAESRATALAQRVLDEAFEERPATALMAAEKVLDSQELKDALQADDLGGYFTAETRERVKGKLRQKHREKVDAGMSLVNEASVYFRKLIHDIDANTDIEALRDGIINDPRLSFYADRWMQQQRLLNLLDNKVRSIRGGGGRGGFDPSTMDERLWKFISRTDIDTDTLKNGFITLVNDILEESRGTMTPEAYKEFQVHMEESLRFGIKLIENREESHSAFNIQKLINDALKERMNGEDDPGTIFALKANAAGLIDRLMPIYNDAIEAGMSPEKAKHMVMSTIIGFLDTPPDITNPRNAYTVLKGLWEGELGYAHNMSPDAEEMATDLAVSLVDQAKRKGITLYPETRELIHNTREEDGQVVYSQILGIKGEHNGVQAWYAVDFTNSRNPNNIAFSRWDEDKEELIPHVVKSIPRENPDFPQEKNNEIAVNSIIDAQIGRVSRTEIMGAIAQVDHNLSEEDITGRMVDSFIKRLIGNIKSDKEEYDSLDPGIRNSLARRRIKNQYTEKELKAYITISVGKSFIEYVMEALKETFDLESMFK